MLKYLSYAFTLGSGMALLAALYSNESVFGNFVFSMPIDVLILCFLAGIVLSIFSKNSLEVKLVQCVISVAPAVILLSRFPTPL